MSWEVPRQSKPTAAELRASLSQLEALSETEDLKEQSSQKWKPNRYLLTVMPIESRVKLLSLKNVFGAKRRCICSRTKKQKAGDPFQHFKANKENSATLFCSRSVLISPSFNPHGGE